MPILRKLLSLPAPGLRDPIPSDCQPSARGLCIPPGRLKSNAAVRLHKPHSGVFYSPAYARNRYMAFDGVCGVAALQRRERGSSRSLRLYVGLRADGLHAAGALAAYLRSASRRILQRCKEWAAPQALPTDTGAFPRLLACYTILSCSFFERLFKALCQRVFAVRRCGLQERLRFLP